MALSGYGSYHPITIPAAKLVGTGTLNSYCCLVTEDMLLSEVTDTGTYSAVNGGGDVAFAADTGGATQLPCNVKRFVTSGTPSSVDVKIWVQLGDVDATGDHTFYIFYGKSGATQPASTDPYGSRAVYSTKGFRCVTHDCQIDEVTGTSFTQNGNATTGTGVYGYDCGDYDGSGDSSQISISGWNITGNLTTLSWVNIDGSGEGYDIVLHMRNSSGFFGIGERTGSSDPRFAMYSNTGSSDASGTGHGSTSAAGWHFIQAYNSSLGSGFAYREDKTGYTSSTSGWYSGTNNTSLMIAAYPDGDQDFGGLIGEVWIYEGNLGNDWGDTLYNNTSDPSTFASAGTAVRIGSSVSVSPGVGGIALTGLAPSVVALSPVNETPTQVVVSLSGYAPTAVALNPVAVTPDVGTVAISGYAPDVAAISPVAANPDKADITILGYSPAAVAIDPVNETPDSGAISISGYSPAVIAISPVNETPGVASIGLSGFVPTVIAINPVAETPAQAVITLSGYSPAAVAIDPVNETPDTATISINGFVPSVSTSNFIEVVPDTGNIGISGYGPTVAALSPIEATPDAGIIALSGYAPGVFASNHITASPDVGQIDITGLSPTVAALSPISVSPGVVGIGLSGFAPTVAALNAVSVIPGPAVIELAGYFPDINISDHITAYPDPASISIIGLAPTVSTVSFIANSRRTYTVGATSRTATAGAGNRTYTPGPSNRRYTIN